MNEIKVWALIADNIVKNTVLARDDDKQDPSYLWIDITNLIPRPGPGWNYDGQNFINPENV